MAKSASAPEPAGPPRLLPLRLASDGQLARLAARGESRAFEAIFRRYHQELYRYCRALLSDSHEAQDALQNTMTAALRSLPGESRRIELRPWLYRVAHNEAISIARRRSDAAPVSDANQDAAPAADVDARDRERLLELVSDLRALPSRQRGALVMRELSGLDYREIAGALGISQGAARQTVYEAREAMRDAGRGREMDCDAVREAISDRDGRVLRGRALRAHLRSCEGCADFRLAISQRSSDLQALAPPLAPLVASGLLASVIGKGGSGAVSAAAGAGGSAAAGGGAIALTKGNALFAAVLLGAGAVGAGSALDVPIVGGEDGERESAGSTEIAGQSQQAHGPRPVDAGPPAGSTTARPTAAGPGRILAATNQPTQSLRGTAARARPRAIRRLPPRATVRASPPGDQTASPARLRTQTATDRRRPRVPAPATPAATRTRRPGSPANPRVRRPGRSTPTRATADLLSTRAAAASPPTDRR